MPTSLVLQLLYILFASFLAYGSFVNIVQLFKSFAMQWYTAWPYLEKNIFNPMEPRVQNPPFLFFLR